MSKPEEPGPYIYIPQREGDQFMHTGTGFPSCLFLRVKVKLKSKTYYDKQSVGQSVLVSSTHLRPSTNLFPPFLITFRQLQVYWCGTPSLMRGWFCTLQLLLSQIWDSPILEFQVPVFISPTNRVTQLYPRHWVSFFGLSEVWSYVMANDQSASLSWCQAPSWGPWSDCYYCQIFVGL
jgi:hypothetical protein